MLSSNLLKNATFLYAGIQIEISGLNNGSILAKLKEKSGDSIDSTYHSTYPKMFWMTMGKEVVCTSEDMLITQMNHAHILWTTSNNATSIIRNADKYESDHFSLILRNIFTMVKILSQKHFFSATYLGIPSMSR